MEEGIEGGVVTVDVHGCVFGAAGDPVDGADAGVEVVVLAFGEGGGGKGEGGGAEEGEEEGLEEHCGWFKRWWNELTGTFKSYERALSDGDKVIGRVVY